MIPDLQQVGEGQPNQEWQKIPDAPAIMADHVSKWYGQVIGLNDVSLAISGGVTGVLGMNGAGKSTLLKMIVGRIRPVRDRSVCLELTRSRIQHLIIA